MTFAGVEQVGQKMDQGSQDPGYRVGQIQHALGRKPCEYGGQPEDTKQACAGQRDDHGSDGVPQPSHNAHNHFHDAAQKIRCADPEKPDASGGDDRGIGRIDGQKRRAQQINADAQYQSDDGHKTKPAKKDLIDPFRLPGSGILACKAYSGLVYRVHGDIDELFDACPRAGSGNDHGAEGVDRRLDQHIGE